MKVVLSGGTGYIGSQVLSYCLNHPAVTSVLILTRRDPGTWSSNPKAKVIIVQDFTSYDEATVNELKTADAALWCLGTSSGDERVDVEFPLAFIDVIKPHRESSSVQSSTPFRYVQLSGAFTEPPPQEGQEPRSLWFFANGRRVRGLTEAKVLQEHSPTTGFEVYLVKPGGVLPANAAFLQKLVGSSLATGISELSATMVDLAVKGNEQKLFSSGEIVVRGRQLLASSS